MDEYFDSPSNPINQVESQAQEQSYRVLCYLDILGFSDKILKFETWEKKDIYKYLIKQYLESTSLMKRDMYGGDIGKERVAAVSWFSDTVIIYSNKLDNLDSYEKSRQIWNILLCSISLFNIMMKIGFPLRGAIDISQFYVDPSKNIFVGRALINAYKESMCNNWAGISLTDTAARDIKNMPNNNYSNSLLTEYDVPMKENKTKRYQVLNWPSMAKYTKEDISNSFAKYSSIEDSEVKRKLDNTIEFLKFCKDKTKRNNKK